MRFLLALFLAVVGAVASAAADAQTLWPTQAEAYNHAATTDLAALRTWCVNSSHGTVSSERVDYLPSYPAYQAWLKCSNAAEITGHLDKFPAAQKCISPDVFDPTAGQCVNGPQRCLNKNDAISSPTTMAGVFGQCVDGCRIGSRTDQGGAGKVDIGSNTISFGAIGYTGETCSGNDLPPVLNDGQTCALAGSLTMCIKPDGRHCATASTGRQICWQPGETGTKTDGAVAQTRGPGTVTPTDPPPPPGETWDPAKKQGPATTTTTTPTGNTITATTINNTTTHGTNAGSGSGDGGEPADGSGDDPSQCDGPCEEEPPQVEPGQGCEVPPVVVGDPVSTMFALQVFKLRCLSDNDEDGRPDWTQLTAEDLLPGAGDGATEGDTDVWSSDAVDVADLDDDGWLPATCPAPWDAPGGTGFSAYFDLDAAALSSWCDYIGAARAILIMFAAFGASVLVAKG